MTTEETPLDRLRHHVTGAIERGEAEAIVARQEPELPPELARWAAMTPEQRLEVMEKVPESKSITRRFRACMAYLRDHPERARITDVDRAAILSIQSNTKAAAAMAAAVKRATCDRCGGPADSFGCTADDLDFFCFPCYPQIHAERRASRPSRAEMVARVNASIHANRTGA